MEWSNRDGLMGKMREFSTLQITCHRHHHHLFHSNDLHQAFHFASKTIKCDREWVELHRVNGYEKLSFLGSDVEWLSSEGSIKSFLRSNSSPFALLCHHQQQHRCNLTLTWTMATKTRMNIEQMATAAIGVKDRNDLIWSLNLPSCSLLVELSIRAASALKRFAAVSSLNCDNCFSAAILRFPAGDELMHSPESNKMKRKIVKNFLDKNKIVSVFLSSLSL